MINGNRVRQARELCGYTQAQLAERLNVHQTTITYLEAGRIEPAEELVVRLAMATQFPPAFFRQGDPPAFPEGSLLFRARTTLPSGVRNQARQYGEVFFEMMERMASRLKVVSPRLPQFTDERDDATIAAHFTRNALGLSPNFPVPDLVRSAERNGVFVVTVPFSHPKLDGFSVWAGTHVRRPIIVLCTGVSGDRLRYTVAHELGHLSLHHTLQGSWHAFNEEADTFASELLMPAEVMEQEIEKPVTLTNLAPLKVRWGVSLRSLVRRAYALKKINDRQYRYLIQQLNREGWRLSEPIPVAVEQPRAARRMAELLYPAKQGGIDYNKLAGDLMLTPSRVREFIALQAGAPSAQSNNTVDNSKSTEDSEGSQPQKVWELKRQQI